MIWNWQHKNWPKFSYDKEQLLGFEEKFLTKAGVLHGSMKHINDQDKESLKVNLISNEALKTSEIEGEILNRDSLQSSIRKHFGLKTDNRKIPPAEQGIAEMMVDLYKTFHLPLSHEYLFKWHEMLTNGRRDLIDIGSYRSHDDPMQVVSGAISNPTIHFEAPASKKVKEEMQQFMTWFNRSEQQDSTKLPILIRAGVAHLYFESIHPFEDGNGRIGRAISEKALSQNLQRPTLIAISHTIESEKKAYYSALHKNSKDLDITNWLIYFSQMVLQAQNHTQSMIDFLIEKGKFYHRFNGKLNPRQEKVVSRIFLEGISGFRGGLSAENYIRITDAPRATTTRDLQSLVEKGAFIKTGELKSTRYFLNIDHDSVKNDNK